MLTNFYSPRYSSSPETVIDVSYFESVIGAAVFDVSGLPKEYFTTTESSDVSWVQSIFQALGLQSLLMSSLRLEGFRHAIVNGQEYRAIVVKQKFQYLALLIRQADFEGIPDSFLRWAHEFEPGSLRSDSRFNVV